MLSRQAVRPAMRSSSSSTAARTGTTCTSSGSVRTAAPRAAPGHPGDPPGRRLEWRGTLAAGRYKLFCSIPGHERRGMRAVLRVR